MLFELAPAHASAQENATVITSRSRARLSLSRAFKFRFSPVGQYNFEPPLNAITRTIEFTLTQFSVAQFRTSVPIFVAFINRELRGHEA
jgi:hypothetical protein